MTSVVKRAEARFKQLCCLGLGGGVVMPALLRELRDIIPCAGSSFFFSNASGELTGIYDENPETARTAPLYVEEFHNRPDRVVGPTFRQSMLTERGVTVPDADLWRDKTAFYRSGLFNALLRPLGYDAPIRLVVRDFEGRPLGGLNVYRAPHAAPFSPAEQRRLAALESFLANALMTPDAPDLALIESGETGVLVCSEDGDLRFATGEGRRLLFLAMQPRVASSVPGPQLPKLPLPLARICRDFARLAAGDGDAGAPIYYCRNAWGGFTFRAQPLAGEGGDGLLAVSIIHSEPVAIRLMRGVSRLPLSPWQAEVSLLLAMGFSHEEIAGRLGISRATVITHGRWVYHLLNVGTRVQLLRELLARTAP